MALAPVAFKQTKHIMRAGWFLRDATDKGIVVLKHVPGRIMLADLLTKAVARPLYLALLRIFDDYAVTGIVYPTDESKITVKNDTPNDVEVPA